MAGIKPAVINGAAAKIKLGGKTIAYAQDISYTIDKITVPVETMGRYEVVTNEPIALSVGGTLNIVRYTKDAYDKGLASVNKDGNSVNEMGQGAHFDPSKLITSETFDVEVFQKIASGDGSSIVKIKDATFTRLSGGLNKRGVLVESFSFVAILADSSGTETNHSGDIDLSV